MKTLRILAISGSLRKGSYNTSLLRAAQGLAPEGMQIEICDWSEIPIYNEDVREKGLPPSVEKFREQIRKSDGILIATPEYNYSIPGPLKNAIDWASRPPEQPFDGKPVALMGASPGALGTVRGQMHLRQCFIFLNGKVLNRPEVYVGGAAEKFNEAGELKDEKTRSFLSKFLQIFEKACQENQS